jgi:hypothetical protein
MSILGTFYWDEYAYYCGVKTQSTEELQAKRNVEVAKIASFGVSATAGVQFSVHTLGISLIGTAYSARQISILEQQVEIIDAELNLRSASIPRVRKRDVAIGATAGTISSTLGFVVFPFGVHELVEDSLTSVATGSGRHTLNTIQNHGVHDALSSEAEWIWNGQHTVADPCIGHGSGLGVAATMPAESTVASQAAGYSVGKAADKVAHSL